jgi:hypothetical protein
MVVQYLNAIIQADTNKRDYGYRRWTYATADVGRQTLMREHHAYSLQPDNGSTSSKMMMRTGLLGHFQAVPPTVLIVESEDE